MVTQLQLGSLVVEVIKKDIKNVHLSVHPPTGAVRIAAPKRMKMDAIRLFAISKLAWIKKHQQRLRAQEREPIPDYIDRESHYLWGKRYLLKVVQRDGPVSIDVQHRTIVLHVRTSTSREKRAAYLEAWYREQLRAALPALLNKWHPLLKVTAERVFVQRMKTKWGSANPVRHTIRLNTHLAKKPLECLDYVVLHELAHFIAPRHDERFIALLDMHMPHWKTIRAQLNHSPLQSERNPPRVV
jgi:predicted metal-dependent hydrolase